MPTVQGCNPPWDEHQGPLETCPQCSPLSGSLWLLTVVKICVSLRTGRRVWTRVVVFLSGGFGMKPTVPQGRRCPLGLPDCRQQKADDPQAAFDKSHSRPLRLNRPNLPLSVELS